jgi:hypothetical protein
MARNHQSPLWNEDLVMAIALTFAGLMALEGKLFPAISVLDSSVVNRLLDWKLLEWWPVLLIVAGAGIWILKLRSNRRRKQPRTTLEGWR